MFDMLSVWAGLWYFPQQQSVHLLFWSPVVPLPLWTCVLHFLSYENGNFHFSLLSLNSMPHHSFLYFLPFPTRCTGSTFNFKASLTKLSLPWYRKQHMVRGAKNWQPQAQTPHWSHFNNRGSQPTRSLPWSVTLNYRRRLLQLTKRLVIPAQEPSCSDTGSV